MRPTAPGVRPAQPCPDALRLFRSGIQSYGENWDGCPDGLKELIQRGQRIGSLLRSMTSQWTWDAGTISELRESVKG